MSERPLMGWSSQDGERRSENDIFAIPGFDVSIITEPMYLEDVHHTSLLTYQRV